MADILIVGGGITGAATAYETARAGARVTLIEGRRRAAMASGWTLGGVRQSGRDPAELPLVSRAVERWATLSDELGGQTFYRRHGNLRLARDAAEVELIRAMVADQRARGLDLSFLATNADVRAVAPAIGPNVLAASFCPTDGHADAPSTVDAYLMAATRRGATIREGELVRALFERGGRVVGVETDAGAVFADVVVLAAGVHAPDLLAPLGLFLPLHPKVVSVIRTAPVPPVFTQVFGVANADCAGRQEVDGALRVTTGIDDWPGAIESWTEEALLPPTGVVADLIARVSAVLPVFATARLARVWGGLIDLTPDGLPVIDRPMDGLVVAAGFSGHGFGIGPVSGELTAALALGVAPPLSVDAFRLSRFSENADGTAALTLHG